jgi:hypothetical protein
MHMGARQGLPTKEQLEKFQNQNKHILI